MGWLLPCSSSWSCLAIRASCSLEVPCPAVPLWQCWAPPVPVQTCPDTQAALTGIKISCPGPGASPSQPWAVPCSSLQGLLRKVQGCAELFPECFPSFQLRKRSPAWAVCEPRGSSLYFMLVCISCLFVFHFSWWAWCSQEGVRCPVCGVWGEELCSVWQQLPVGLELTRSRLCLILLLFWKPENCSLFTVFSVTRGCVSPQQSCMIHIRWGSVPVASHNPGQVGSIQVTELSPLCRQSRGSCNISEMK